MGRQRAICRTDGGRGNSGWERLLPREQRLFIAHKFSLFYDAITDFVGEGLTCAKYEAIYREQVEKRTFARIEATTLTLTVPKRSSSALFPSNFPSPVFEPAPVSVPVSVKVAAEPPTHVQDVTRRVLDEDVTEVVVFHSPKWADVRRARRYYESKADWQGLFLLRTMRRSDPAIRLY